ncbi:MAG: leucyl aminopeptidase, partial [Paracoccaceae bacterium]
MGDYFDLKQTDLKLLEDSEGRICIVVHPDRKLDQTARRLNRLTKGAIDRLFLDDGFSSRKS